MFIRSTVVAVISLVTISAVQNSEALAQLDARSQAGSNFMLKYSVPTQAKIEERKKIQPALTSWDAGKQAFRKLDTRRKFSIKKLGSNNVLKIARSEARKNKAEFKDVFAMGFVSECYGLPVGQVEELANKMRLKKELTEIVSVVNYLQ